MAERSFIPLSVPVLCGNEKKYVDHCLDTGWISSVGEFVNRFEKEFASYTGAAHAVAVVNGTSALHLALLVAGVKPGEEVLVPALTFIAPINAVTYAGAVPVFLDVEEETMGLSPSSFEEFVASSCELRDGILFNRSTGRRITALLPVHIYGHACRMSALLPLARKYGMILLEDAAEAIGTLCDGCHAGTIGSIGSFSFNGNKTLTTGGGGMLVTNDEAYAKRLRHLSTQAKSDELYYRHDEIGYNYRMSNVQAAIGVAQLESFPAALERKRGIHAHYEREFCKLPLSLFGEAPWCRSNYWMAVLTLSQEMGVRDRFMAHMNGCGIQARPLWDLNNRHPMYCGNPCAALPVSEKLYDRCVCIPCGQHMSDGDVERVISAVRGFFGS
ncbi:MAG: hypothetical protein A2X49_03145 [Lentisphaerae bacterium GWF2_52_8]|nr:MAG: hypothetical protein A2X49_03145 [Lentisphaerae bacterium GWF2_52_8]